MARVALAAVVVGRGVVAVTPRAQVVALAVTQRVAGADRVVAPGLP